MSQIHGGLQMIDFITAALFKMEYNGFFNAVISVMFIIAVIYGCVSLFNDTPQTNKKMKSYRRPNNSRIESEEHYNDYDPSWDDAYFEKTGIEPWFDDNSKR